MFFQVTVEELKAHLQSKAEVERQLSLERGGEMINLRMQKVIEMTKTQQQDHKMLLAMADKAIDRHYKRFQVCTWLANHLPQQHGITLTLDEARELELIPAEEGWTPPRTTGSGTY